MWMRVVAAALSLVAGAHAYGKPPGERQREILSRKLVTDVEVTATGGSSAAEESTTEEATAVLAAG